MTQASQSPLWRLVTKKSSPIVPLAVEGVGPPIYLVHSIAGEVTGYHSLAKKIGAGCKVYGIQAPREKMSGEFAENIQAAAAYYVENLTQFQPQGPLLLGGWSSGGPIALEMAQMLRAAGREVLLLVNLDGLLFNTGGELSAWHPLYQWKLLRNLPVWIGDNIFQGWGVRGVFKRIKRELKLNFESLLGRREKWPGSNVDAFMDTSALPPEQRAFARSLGRAVELYEPKPYDGDVLVFASRAQPLLHLLQVDTAWKTIAPQCEIVYIDGNHLTLMKEPHVDAVADHLRQSIMKLGTTDWYLCGPEASRPTEILEVDTSF
jgi:thioesterase domain-containing protein